MSVLLAVDRLFPALPKVTLPSFAATASSSSSLPSLCTSSSSSTQRRCRSIDIAGVGIFMYTVGVCIHGHDHGIVRWGVVGAVINDITSKCLKHMIRQPRPGSPPASDTFGMPSTHSQDAAFFAAYTALGGFLKGVLGDHVWLRLFLAFTTAACVAWSRVIKGKHTPSQVIAGVLLGGSFATTWFILYKLLLDSKQVVLPFLT